ncbi:helix-turn-helix transcriptional regulator [candidate division KSB1 bacterium]|nr:helix-turn-helix transcriptional regulator [candidate division KSB1 bacterium]
MRNRHGKRCGCYRERHNRWIEPSILFLLYEGTHHGYDLMSRLPDLGFVQDPVDPGAVYRMLRHLEDGDLVKSQWDTTGSGPAKRLYTITEAGKEHLKLWTDALRQRRDSLDEFLKRMQQLEEK